jgi:hypothetical protein
MLKEAMTHIPGQCHASHPAAFWNGVAGCLHGCDQVLRLHGCWRLGDSLAQDAIARLAQHCKLRVLDIRDTGITVDDGLVTALKCAGSLEELSVSTMRQDHCKPTYIC